MKPHLLHVFATFAAGGPQVRTARLIAGLGERYRHSIVALDGCTDARELLPAQADARVLPAPRRAGSLATVRALRGLFSAERPDLVLSYNWGAIDAVLASRLGGRRPLLHHEDGFRPDEVGRYKLRRVWTRRLALRGASGVVVPSENLRRIALELWRLPPALVHHVPNGIQQADFPAHDGNPELRAELGIPLEAFVIGSVGHLREEKNFPRLVRALAAMRVPGAHLVLLGAGPAREAIERAIRDHGLEARVHLVGHQVRPQAHYRAMDAFALSSDTEQMPVALLEAMAAGLPAVATDVGDVRRMLPEEGHAELVPLDTAGVAGAAAELAGRLDRLARDPARRAALGAANARRVAERYSFPGMLAAYEALYRAALGADAR